MAVGSVSSGGASDAGPGPKNDADPIVGPPMTSLRTGVHAVVAAMPISSANLAQRRIEINPSLFTAVNDFVMLSSLKCRAMILAYLRTGEHFEERGPSRVHATEYACRSQTAPRAR